MGGDRGGKETPEVPARRAVSWEVAVHGSRVKGRGAVLHLLERGVATLIIWNPSV